MINQILLSCNNH